MRIRLALEPLSSPHREPAPSVLDSWRNWVASKCPREKPETPGERSDEASTLRFAGHPVPKSYLPPFDQ
jgi:hypothetical protein